MESDEIMRKMSAIALEQATEMLARQADEAAKHTSPHINGPDALRAFAAAIRSTNAKQYPKADGVPS